jgi:hypothetical protein
MAALEASTLAAERREDAANNLRQSRTRLSWYDHLPAVEAAMAKDDHIGKLRRAAGWDHDERGWFGLHPETGEVVLADDWEDETGLPMPEAVK